MFQLALNGTGHTGDELLLHQEEDGSSGDGGQNDGAHHHAVVGGVGCAHGGQDQGQGPLVAGLQGDQILYNLVRSLDILKAVIVVSKKLLVLFQDLFMVF